MKKNLKLIACLNIGVSSLVMGASLEAVDFAENVKPVFRRNHLGYWVTNDGSYLMGGQHF